MYVGSLRGNDIKPTLYPSYVGMKISAKGKVSSIFHFGFRKDIALLPFFITVQESIPDGEILL